MPRRALSEYLDKRDFGATPEPRGTARPKTTGPLAFVVQRHEASRLHYDLRLELDGVLVSFAVPRGPSANVSEKRLAVPTEDHPLDYGGFEGVIPAGEYGAGSVIIWDAGTYAPDEPHLLFHDRAQAEQTVRDGLDAGKLSLTFRGRRLKGSWTLVRTGTNWLLIKHRDAFADPPRDLASFSTSIVSGRTNKDAAAGDSLSESGEAHYAPHSLAGSRPRRMQPIPPMLAAAGKPIPGEWSYEPKLDGIRVAVYVDGGTVRLVSRGGHDITAAYPGIVRACAALPVASAVLDGEIVALTPAGKPSFELLQQRMNLQGSADVRRAESSVPTSCYVFDLLYLDGFDLLQVPLQQRREALARVIVPGNRLREVTTIDLPSDEAFEVAVGHGFEGIIAKRPGSRYEAGRRSDSWRKWKAQSRGVFVVGGFTRGEGSRSSTFGGLLLGEPTPAGLEYRGRVGTGFSAAQTRELRKQLDQLPASSSPFAGTVPAARDVTWVRPVLSVEVEFGEQTAGGVLRAPVFKRLVSDNAGPAPGLAPSPDDSGHDTLLAQLETPRQSATLEGDGWSVRVTNLDKELWPRAGERSPMTKRDLLRHAIRAWPVAEPHFRDRPLTVTRYPEGITGQRFYQRHLDTARPSFVETVRVFSDSEGKDRDYVLCNNLPTLLHLCQQAALEWHISLARVTPASGVEEGTTDFSGSLKAVETSVLNYPDILLFDLDSYLYEGGEAPGEEPRPHPHGFAAARDAALIFREMLDGMGLPSYVKTSGKTGLHVCVPLTRTLTFAAVRAVATTFGSEMVRRHPRLLTTEWDTRKRRGKVFVDVNQNARSRAIVAPLSPRAHPGGPLSMPVRWDDLRSLELGAFALPFDGSTFVDPWQGFHDAAVDLRASIGVE